MLTTKQLLRQLGTYWSKNYQDDRFLNGLLTAQLGLQKQVETNLEELILSSFRKHIPVYHTEHVYAFSLTPDKRNNCQQAIPKFNDELAYFLTYNGNSNWLDVCDKYGMPSPVGATYALPLANVVSVAKIVDDPVNPEIELYPGKDFELASDAIKFKEDPCKDNKAREYFLIDVKQDFRWISKHFGCLLNVDAKSSELYRRVVDDIFGAYITGSNSVDVFNILSEVTGNVIAREAGTIIEVASDSVKTENNEYAILPGHSACVKVGDKVSAGDSLTNEFTPLYINQLAQPNELPAVLLPKRYLGSDYFYGLIFINEDVPVTNINGQDRFKVIGNRHDVEHFWQDFEVNCRRLTEGRNDKPTEYLGNEVIRRVSHNYTRKVNPYEFFIEHIGRYHYTLISIDHVKLPTELSLDQLPLRQLMPPWNTLLIQRRVTVDYDTTISGPTDAAEIGMEVAPILECDYSLNVEQQIYARAKVNRKYDELAYLVIRLSQISPCSLQISVDTPVSNRINLEGTIYWDWEKNPAAKTIYDAKNKYYSYDYGDKATHNVKVVIWDKNHIVEEFITLDCRDCKLMGFRIEQTNSCIGAITVTTCGEDNGDISGTIYWDYDVDKSITTAYSTSTESYYHKYNDKLLHNVHIEIKDAFNTFEEDIVLGCRDCGLIDFNVEPTSRPTGVVITTDVLDRDKNSVSGIIYWDYPKLAPSTPYDMDIINYEHEYSDISQHTVRVEISDDCRTLAKEVTLNACDAAVIADGPYEVHVVVYYDQIITTGSKTVTTGQHLCNNANFNLQLIAGDNEVVVPINLNNSNAHGDHGRPAGSCHANDRYGGEAVVIMENTCQFSAIFACLVKDISGTSCHMGAERCDIAIKSLKNNKWFYQERVTITSSTENRLQLNTVARDFEYDDFINYQTNAPAVTGGGDTRATIKWTRVTKN